MLRIVKVRSRRPERLHRRSIHPSQPLSRQLSAKRQHSPSSDDSLVQDPKKSSNAIDDPPMQQSAGSSSSPHSGAESQLSQILSRLAQNGAALRLRMDEVTATAAARASRLGQSLNEVTGYDEIEKLKKAVADNERRMYEARQAAKDAKKAYDQAVLRRSSSQREVNDLLQRKSTWTEDDVLRFTRLVREDHVVEQEEARAKALAQQADDHVDKQFNELMRSILSRYHEEQAWSDKIRKASTYGSLLALGLNVVVFISAIVVVEPWKRKRMVQSFEATVVGMHEEIKNLVDKRMEELVTRQDTLHKAIDSIPAMSPPSEKVEQNSIPPVGLESETTVNPSVAEWIDVRQLPLPISTLTLIGAGAIGWMLRTMIS